MNKALILKYKTEFDYWLNGGNVQVYYKKDDEPKWLTDEECIEYEGHDNFSHIIRNSLEPEDVLIIIDDEYIEFRKALAEGKIVEFKHPQVGYDEWEIVTPEHLFQSIVSGREYRIKPEEPKFKVGDWLIEIHSGSYAKVLEVFTQEVRVKLYDCNSIITTENTDFKLWEPKEGDICWFWNKSNIYPRLATFINESLGSYYADTSNDGFDFCEPFIGQLPSYLKE